MLRRVLVMIPTLLLLALGAQFLATLAPGDPAENYARLHSTSGVATPAMIEHARVLLGLNRPFFVRYVDWVAGALHGDFGISYSRQDTVAAEIGGRLGATLELALTALALTVTVAIPLGAFAALRHGSWFDHSLRAGSLLFASIPAFFLGYVLIAVFGTQLNLLPVAGREQATSIVLPAVTLAAAGIATASRLLRASMLEVLSDDFIRTARGKGLRSVRIVARHALPNAALPVITYLGYLFGYLLAGSVVIETVFAWPGVGQLLAEAVAERDYPMIQGLIVIAGTFFLVLNLLVDLSYRLIDPRVRLAGQ
ncbi:MAG: ABC transporter permease [Candidatus Dormibacteria bacterium]